jgi:hypothetical protein
VPGESLAAVAGAGHHPPHDRVAPDHRDGGARCAAGRPGRRDPNRPAPAAEHPRRATLEAHNGELLAHRRASLAELLADAEQWARTISPAEVLSQIGSPFAPDQQPAPGKKLNHAA